MEHKMTVKEKFKKFVSDHEEAIVNITAYAVGFGAIVATALIAGRMLEKTYEKEVSKNMATYNSWADGENKWIDEQNENGKTVYLLHDWTYLTLPAETETEWIDRR